jgi:ribose/xylose/arabinose/galactoside ABC-type transport system permease subunit
MGEHIWNRAEGFIQKVVLANRAAFFALVLAVILFIATPYFLTEQNLLNLADQIVIFTLVAMGATFVLGAGEIDLSIIGVVPLVGAIVAWLLVNPQWPTWAAVLVGLLVGIGCGMLNGLLTSLLKLPSFIVTLATGAVFQGFMYVMTNLTPITNLPETFVKIGQGHVGRFTLPTVLLLPFIAVMLVIEKKTVFSQHLIALANNSEAVRVAGVRTGFLKFKLFTLMGLMSAIAGIILTARSASAQIDAGSSLLLVVIAAVVIGGTPIFGGKIMIVGTVFGSLTLGLISDGLDLLSIPTTFQTATQGIVILLALYVDSQTTQFTNRVQKRALRRALGSDRSAAGRSITDAPVATAEETAR